MVAPSVLWLTAFQLQASKSLTVLYNSYREDFFFLFFFFFFYTHCVSHSGALVGHNIHGNTPVPGFPNCERFVLLSAPRAEQHSSSSPDSMHPPLHVCLFFCQYLNQFSFPSIVTHLYFANIFFFFFFCSCYRAFVWLIKTNQSVLLLLYCTIH